MLKQPPKRVIFCTYPSIYSDIVLKELLRAEEVELVGVVLSNRVLNKNYNLLYASWRQIRRSGLAYAIYLFVITDFYRVLRRFSGRPASGRYLIKSGIPVLETRDINNSEGLAFIKESRADAMLSAHFNQLVGEEILSLEDLSCLNIHPSLLPEYKGVDPAFYAMLRGEKATGVTVHFQDVAFDTGRVLEQRKQEIWRRDSLLGLNLRLFRLGALAAVTQISRLTAGIQGKPQFEGGRYDSWPSTGDVKEFRRSRKLFGWREALSASPD